MGSSYASSFEVLHLFDKANNRIVRYDPINRILLGSYARNYTNDAYSLSVKNDTAMLWDFQMSEVLTFNASTGTPMSRFAVGFGSGITSEISAGIAHYRLASQSATLYTPSGMVLGTLAGASNASGYSSVFENSSHYFLYNGNTTTMRRFRKSDLGLDWTWTNPILPTNYLQWDVTTAIWNGQFSMVFADRGSNRIGFVDAQNGGGQFYNLNGVSGISGLATGHANWVYVGVTTTQARTQILRMNPINGTVTVVFDAPTTEYNWESMSIVVAPEPATMAALGVGLVALLRRRRKAV